MMWMFCVWSFLGGFAVGCFTIFVLFAFMAHEKDVKYTKIIEKLHYEIGDHRAKITSLEGKNEKLTEIIDNVQEALKLEVFCVISDTKDRL